MAINLKGRIPRPKSDTSGRWIALGIGVLVLALCAVAYGFKIRIDRKRAMKEQQVTAAVASEPARSNRKEVESADADFPAATPAAGQNAGQQNPAAGAVNAAGGALRNAAQTIANPYPPQNAYPPVQSWAQPVQETPEQIQYRELMKTLEERQARLKQAILDSTPIASQRPPQTAPQTPQPDPLRNEIDPMNTLPGRSPALSPARTVADQNGQEDKRKFQTDTTETAGDYLKTTRVPPVSPWVVQRGTVIPAELPAKLVSDLPGDLIAQVSRDVMDTATQRFVMFPAGSRLVGEYNSNVSYAQNRVQVAWVAIYLPDGSHIDIGRMPAHAADGATGLKDQTDNHWKRIIGGVALSSMLAAGLQISQNRTNGSVLQYPSTGQEAASAVGTQAAELGQQMTNRNMNIQPRLKIRPGEIFAVSVTRDLVFPGPYQPINGDVR